MNDAPGKAMVDRCPECGVETIDTWDIVADASGYDYQEWPDIYWCPHCGRIADRHGKIQVPFIVEHGEL